MPSEELKLNVSVNGPGEAEAGLNRVAAAERGVVDATNQAAPAAEDAGRKTGDLGKELFGAERAGQEFRRLLGLLPPDIAMAVEQLVGMGRAASSVTVGMNAVALAGIGLAMIYNMLTAAESKSRQEMQAVADAQAKQFENYKAITEQVRELIAAENELSANRASVNTYKSLTERALSAAGGTTLGSEKDIAELAAAADQLDNRRLSIFAMWLSAGRGHGISSQADRLSQFQADVSTNKNLESELTAAMDLEFKRGPEMFRSASQSRAMQSTGMTQVAQGEAALKSVVERMKAEGKKADEQSLRDQLAAWSSPKVAWTPRGPLMEMLDKYPELGGYVPDKSTGATLYQIVYQGGTHYHNADRFNPAGRISQQQD